MKFARESDIALPTIPNYGGAVMVELAGWLLDMQAFQILDARLSYTLYDNNGSAAVTLLSLDVQLVLGSPGVWLAEPDSRIVSSGSAESRTAAASIGVGTIIMSPLGFPLIKSSELTLQARMRVQTAAVTNPDDSRRLAFIFSLSAIEALTGTPGLEFMNRLVFNHATF